MPHLWADCVLCKCFCKRQRTWKKMNPLCPCQVGEKGASFGSLLMHTWVLHWRGLHVALFNNIMQPPSPRVSHYMVCQNILVKGKGEQQLGELMQSKKFLLDRSGDVFYLNDLTFIRKSQEECESFPFFFLKAHAVMMNSWICLRRRSRAAFLRWPSYGILFLTLLDQHWEVVLVAENWDLQTSCWSEVFGGSKALWQSGDVRNYLNTCQLLWSARS